MKTTRTLTSKVPHDQLEFLYLKALGKLSDNLIDHINKFIQKDFNEDFTLVHFLLKYDENKINESSIWIYLEGDSEYIFSGKNWEFYSDFKSLPLMTAELLEDILSKFSLEEILFKWFAECWWKAGGWYYAKPAVYYVGTTTFSSSVKLTQKTL